VSRRRPRLSRTAGTVTIVALLVVNGWLVLLNLSKHDRLPFDAGVVPGIEASGELADAGGSGRDGRSDGAIAGGDQTTTLADVDASLPAEGDGGVSSVGVGGAGDNWPGGRGPVPDGPPEPRRILLTVDGELKIVGSAPSWSVVTGLVDVLGRRSGLGPLRVVTREVTWHPEASDRVDDGVVEVERLLLYESGAIGVPADVGEVVDPLVALLSARPDLYAVVVAHVDDLGDSDENAAVALSRATAVAESVADRGIDRGRLVTIVAPVDPDAPVGDDATTRRFNRRVEIRIENLLVPDPVG
jgi:hypothetical protein